MSKTGYLGKHNCTEHAQCIIMTIIRGLLNCMRAGYNSSNDIHDEFVLVNGSLDNCHDQHARCDQDHYPPGVTEASSSWVFTALCRASFQEGRNVIY